MKKLLFFFAFFFLVISCEKEPFNEEYNYIYGDWVPVHLDYGMSSDIYPQLLCDLLQILKKGTYKVIRNGNIVESGRIEARLQTVNKLSIVFVPKKMDFGSDSFIRLPHSSAMNVVTYSKDSIDLQNTALDGGYFRLTLRRKN